MVNSPIVTMVKTQQRPTLPGGKTTFPFYEFHGPMRPVGHMGPMGLMRLMPMEPIWSPWSPLASVPW